MRTASWLPAQRLLRLLLLLLLMQQLLQPAAAATCLIDGAAVELGQVAGERGCGAAGWATVRLDSFEAEGAAQGWGGGGRRVDCGSRGPLLALGTGAASSVFALGGLPHGRVLLALELLAAADSWAGVEVTLEADGAGVWSSSVHGDSALQGVSFFRQ